MLCCQILRSRPVGDKIALDRQRGHAAQLSVCNSQRRQLRTGHGKRLDLRSPDLIKLGQRPQIIHQRGKGIRSGTGQNRVPRRYKGRVDLRLQRRIVRDLGGRAGDRQVD